MAVRENGIRSFTESHKQNIARANCGKSLSASHRLAISVANQGRSHRLDEGKALGTCAVELRQLGLTISDIARRLGISRSTVYNMVARRHWSTRPEPQPGQEP
jgi:transposase-like protein